MTSSTHILTRGSDSRRLELNNAKPRGKILTQFLPALPELAESGLAGWGVLIGTVIVSVLAIMTVASPGFPLITLSP